MTYALNTVCTITIYGLDKGVSEVDAVEEAFKLLRDYEDHLSKTIDTSDIAKINNANGGKVQVKDETMEVINAGIYFGGLSDGVFDITIGKVSDLWNFSDTEHIGKVPSDEEIKTTLSHVNWKGIVTEKGENEVSLVDSEMEIDLGGIAKGYIADKISEKLEELGVYSAVVNLGGNIVLLGGKAKSKNSTKETDFVTGINDPFNANEYGLIARYSGRDITMVTSGTYERYIEVDGVKYHHILDTKTGYPVETDIEQVTIISGKGNSMMADGYSTLCLALGALKAKELIEKQEGYEAVILKTDGTIIVTSGLEGNENFVLY